MNDVIEIDGHKAVLAFDPETGSIRGEFVGLNGGADFHGRSLDELVAEGRTSLRVYDEFCRERGIEPM